MRLVNFLFVIAALVASAGAAHIFFNASEVNPEDQKRAVLEEELSRVLVLAEQGDVNAQHRMGEIYRTSEPPLRDYAKALNWYRKSAERGNTKSQFALGQMYANGLGVTQNYYRAAEWYRLAANLSGHAEAQFSLGELYFHGRGVPSSFGVAIEWYTKAANQGHGVAQYFLGQINKEGWGVPANLITAYKWFKLAESKTEEIKAHNHRNNPKQALADLVAHMNSSQIKAGEKALRDWQPGR